MWKVCDIAAITNKNRSACCPYDQIMDTMGRSGTINEVNLEFFNPFRW